VVVEQAERVAGQVRISVRPRAVKGLCPRCGGAAARSRRRERAWASTERLLNVHFQMPPELVAVELDCDAGRGLPGAGHRRARLLTGADLADDGVIHVDGVGGVGRPRPLVADGALVGLLPGCSAW